MSSAALDRFMPRAGRKGHAGMKSRYGLATLLAFCAMQSALASGQESLCSQLRVFASAVPSAQERKVTLRGGWGGHSPGIVKTHTCEHAGDGPGRTLCAYLVQNTSWEHGQVNARRAAECVDSIGKQAFLASLGNPQGAAKLQGSLKDSGGTLSLRFEPGSISRLSITVSGAVR